ncbi:MAG TPA: hypothetical protein VGR19_01170, partial [Allosphingosinicella sp.]|nr:hypothetical protein [Allosphingosinicella sp.]
LAILAVLLVAGALWFAREPAQRQEFAVAVMPFRDMSPGQDQAHIGEGIAEEIMSLLSTDTAIATIGRSSAWQFRDQPAQLAQIGATHVLEGSVRSGEDRLVLTASLSELSSGETVWSQRFEQPPARIFDVQEQIGQAVAKQLHGIFEAERQIEMSSRSRTTPRAYHLYLAARAANQERSFENATRAEALLEKALAIDPGFGPAHAEMAVAQALIGQSRPTGDGGFDRRKAAFHAERAIKLAPRLSDAHVAVGVIADDPDERLKRFRIAAELDPSNSRAWNSLGLTQLNKRCEIRDSAESFRRAAKIDPLSVPIQQNLASTLHWAGRRQEAEEAVRSFLAVSKNPADGARLLMEHHFMNGRIAEATKQARVGLQVHPGDPQLATYLGFGLHWLGRTREAAPALPAGLRPVIGPYWSGQYSNAARAALRTPPSQTYRSPAVRAGVKAFVWNGQPGAALKTLLGSRTLAEFESERDCFQHDAAPIAQALLGTGRRKEAAAVISRAERDLRHAMATGYSAPDRLVYAASLAAVRGQNDKAISFLEQAVAGGWSNQWQPDSPGLSDPVFAGLRLSPRYRAIQRIIESRVAEQARR